MSFIDLFARERTAIVIVFGTLFMAGCHAPTATNSSAPAGDINPTVTATAPPFSDAEPERYAAEVWQTKPDGSVKKFFIARDGEKWRIETDHGGQGQITTIRNDQMYVAAEAHGAYCEYPPSSPDGGRADIVRNVTRQMLNKRGSAIYQMISSAAGLDIYNVVLSDTEPGYESIITFDQKLGIPTKKQLFTVSADGQRKPDTTIELKNFTTSPAETLFDPPRAYKKVAVDEMRTQIADLQL